MERHRPAQPTTASIPDALFHRQIYSRYHLLKHLVDGITSSIGSLPLRSDFEKCKVPSGKNRKRELAYQEHSSRIRR